MRDINAKIIFAKTTFFANLSLQFHSLYSYLYLVIFIVAMETNQKPLYTEWVQADMHYWSSIVEVFVLLRSLGICDFFATPVVADVIQQKV